MPRVRKSGVAVLLCALSWCVATPTTAAERGARIGIDVSHHSGEIDWGEIEREAIGFVFLKATEGVDDPDPDFEAHWAAVGELGLPRGAYHFFVTEDDPEEQARFFLEHARFVPGELVPVVDVEIVGHDTTGDLAEKLRRFLEIVEAEVGAPPIIYTTARFWDEHFGPGFERYPLWVAEYDVESPALPQGWSEWALWQFEGDAEVPGIEKGADKSRLHEGLGLEALLIPRERPAP